MSTCPCGSTLNLEECCLPYIQEDAIPVTSEALMRSRYTAYILKAVDYLIETTHPSQRKHFSKKSIMEWANECNWIRLQVVHSSSNEVAFIAVYKDAKGNLHEHREWSTFKQEMGKWYYVDGRDF